MARRNYGKGAKNPRRVYYYRKGARRMRTKKIGLFNIIGVGMGLGMSAFGPNGAVFSNFKSDPSGNAKYIANGIIAGVSGYDMENHDWKVANLTNFWAPVIGFYLVDKIAKKMGFGDLRIFRNIRGA